MAYQRQVVDDVLDEVFPHLSAIALEGAKGEVKLAANLTDHDVRHLRWLATNLGDRVADVIAVTTGEFAYRRPDGVAVVPLALLGP